MESKIEKIKKLIASGESETVEFKESTQRWLNEIKTKTSPSLFPDIEEIQLNGKKILWLKIDEFPIKPVSYQGRYYKRAQNSNHQMSLGEISDMYLKTFNSSWDYYTDEEHSLDDISFEKIEKVMAILKERGMDIRETPIEFLKKLDLIKDDRPTKGCYLLFLKDFSILTTIELGRFQTETVIKDSHRLQSDVLNEVEGVMDFIKKHINKRIEFDGSIQNIEIWDYPLDALREIVLNMIIHRDYSSSYDSIVKVFDDRIDFFNPGKFPEELSFEKLMNNEYYSMPRNKKIADIVKRIGWIEKYGAGIRRVNEAFKAAGLKKPEFKSVPGGVLVRVFAENANVTENVTENVTDSRLKKILDMVKEKPDITVDDIAQICRVNRRTILRDIEDLKKKELIKRIGSAKTGHWETIENEEGK
ncbi:MAG: ATP-binding protein [bacterium]